MAYDYQAHDTFISTPKLASIEMSYDDYHALVKKRDDAVYFYASQPEHSPPYGNHYVIIGRDSIRIKAFELEFEKKIKAEEAKQDEAIKAKHVHFAEPEVKVDPALEAVKKECEERERDIGLVSSQTGATFQDAWEALQKHDGDVVEAVMALSAPVIPALIEETGKLTLPQAAMIYPTP